MIFFSCYSILATLNSADLKDPVQCGILERVHDWSQKSQVPLFGSYVIMEKSLIYFNLFLQLQNTTLGIAALRIAPGEQYRPY